MAPRGRKPKPTHLKLVTGNPGKRALNENEPKPPPSLPSPPSHLDEEARLEWERLSEQLYALGCLSEIDRAALAAYVQAIRVGYAPSGLLPRWRAASMSVTPQSHTAAKLVSPTV